MIKRSHWKWRGAAGHFCAASSCSFRLCTEIGAVRISTVGAYYPPISSPPDQMVMVNANGHYETMVFRLSPQGEVEDWESLDTVTLLHKGDPYDSDKKAEAQHEAMCLKWAELEDA